MITMLFNLSPMESYQIAVITDNGPLAQIEKLPSNELFIRKSYITQELVNKKDST